ncbi:LuxR family transcriptional regulator [Actinomycetospora cinnamomea]|uniref:LuxR family transcriptional regulator n=1 Tax=Actinomycetospora cinnamomea TaxID=663609 RepID=UPI000E323BBB|nr:LuxR family transcriptional regulator [Actinomycetospora cinnamomea]
MEQDARARAHRSCRERAWRAACAEFAAAERSTELAAGDLETWAVASYLIGRFDAAYRAWASAHHAWSEAGEPGRSVRCAFWQGLTLVLRGEHARGGGWFARAARVLEHCPPDAPEHAYLRLPAALQTLEGGDAETALRVFVEAGALGDASGDRDLATLGRLGQGQALVALGEVGRGTAMLDEAMLAVVDDEVTPLAAGLVYCAVIITCQRAFDLQRAQRWTTALSAWCAEQQGIKPYRGQCLVHRSQLLQLRGEWAEAMAEIRAACTHLADLPGDAAQGMAFYQLAELQRVRGAFGEAEDAYREAHRWAHPVQPGMALLRLAQGRVGDAMAALRRALEDDLVPAERVRVLAAFVEVAVAAGEPAEARRAVADLDGLAARFASPHLEAIHDHARGQMLLADGDAAGALRPLGSARRTWQQLDAPDEAARSAAHLGAAYRSLGDHDSAVLEWDTARRRFTEVGAVTDLARLDELCGTPGRHPGGLTAREVEVLVHVAAGRTNRQVAAALVVSEHTVRRHVHNIFAKLGVASRAEATAWAYQEGVVSTRRG